MSTLLGLNFYICLDIVLRWFIGLETDVCGLLGLGGLEAWKGFDVW